jgi:hypothetical protein
VAGIGSTAYNLYNQYENQEYQSKLRSMAQDPAKMNAYAAQFTQPLTAGLQTGVANAAQADLATRGLTDSPQISQQVYAQAIAPYLQQNQQQGYQNALQALQVGGGAVNPNNSSTATIAALAKMFAGGPPSATSAPGTLPPLQSYINAQAPGQINQPPQLGAAPGPIDTSGWGGGGGEGADLSMFPAGAPNSPDYTSFLTAGQGGDYGDSGA